MNIEKNGDLSPLVSTTLMRHSSQLMWTHCLSKKRSCLVKKWCRSCPCGWSTYSV